MAATWEVFPIAVSARVPPLLIKVSLQDSSYAVQLTDLTYIWSESLDKHQIIERALKEDTSIDPSEDQSQLKILLDRIQSALKGHQETSLKLKQWDDGHAIDVHLTASLPRPLEPLTWRLHLTRLSPFAVRSEIVLPALGQLHLKNQNVTQLVRALYEKDHVIDKLLDKLEIAGIDLTTVFPGAAGIKGSKTGPQREQAAPYVKGLGKFDFRKWQESVSPADIKALSLETLLSEVVAEASPHSLGEAIKQFDGVLFECWWRELDGHSGLSASLEDPVKRRQGLARRTIARTETSNGEDEFQRQTTPPELKSPTREDRSKAQQRAPSSGSSVSPSTSEDKEDGTDDQNDLNERASRLHQEDKLHSPWKPKIVSTEPLPGENEPTQSKSARKKLGLIGGPKAKPSTPIVNQRSTDSAQPYSSQSQSVELSEHHDDRAGTQTTISSKPRRPKLGTIGGSRADRSLASPSNSASPSTPSQRLGVIAGKGRSVRDSMHTGSKGLDEMVQGNARERAEDALVTEVSPCVQNIPRESSQERADRKRLELKRQIEQKSKAPAKKKRKF